MKPQDLRIGNLLMIDGQVKNVWALDEEGVNGLTDNYDSMVTHYPKTVEPIPLTEDWLIRLGFFVSPELIALNGIAIGRFNGRFYINLQDCAGQVVRKIKLDFVHELQNTVKVFTGQELEVKTIA